MSDGILGAGPTFNTRMLPRPVQVPASAPVLPHTVPHVQEDSSGKRQWMPKMDFLRFDGTDVRIWLDKCEAFFRLYNIPDSFKVTSASLYLSDNVAHWYHAFKQSSAYHTWPQFCAAILQEFDVNVYRQKMKDLMSLKQLDSVEDYKQQFLQLVYTVRLYEPSISDTFLVTRFIMGLKAELRSVVELQIPTNVQTAAMYASVQEGLLLQQKTVRPSYQKTAFSKSEARPVLATGDLWKAKQLKEYRCANGLCYKCGEKFAPGHVCSQLPVPGAQLKVAEVVMPNEIISDALLDALVEPSTEECATISVTAMSGAAHPKTIQLRGLGGKPSCAHINGFRQHTYFCGPVTVKQDFSHN